MTRPRRLPPPVPIVIQVDYREVAVAGEACQTRTFCWVPYGAYLTGLRVLDADGHELGRARFDAAGGGHGGG